MKTKKENLIVSDTSPLFNDPVQALANFLDNGNNTVVLPLMVINEIDDHKKSLNTFKAANAREVSRQADKLGLDEQPFFKSEAETDWDGIPEYLSRGIPDHIILATFNYVVRNYKGFDSYKLVSDDSGMRRKAKAIFKNNPKVIIESYFANQVKDSNKLKEVPVVSIDDFAAELTIDYDPKIFGELYQNSGIVIEYREKKNLFIRQGDELKMIKNDFSLFGLNAVSGNNQPNYAQLLAFFLVSDPSVRCLFLEGSAGTGKTLIATAGALAQKGDYDQIIITNPMVPLSGNDRMGFLPGDANDKINPWLMPFKQNIKFLETKFPDKMRSLALKSFYHSAEISKKKNGNGNSDSNSIIAEEKFYLKYGLDIQPLQFIRGQTITNSIIIIEEAHNLTAHEIITILTRLGKGSKIIICGDLKQIDLPYLSQSSSGLIYGIEKLIGFSEEARMVGAVRLDYSLRSEFVHYANKRFSKP